MRRGAGRWIAARSLAARGLAAASLALLALAHPAGAQDSVAPRINVAPAIEAQPGSQAPLPISIAPVTAIPKRVFISLRGLPPSVVLTQGQPVGPGSWAVPLAGLPALKAHIPTGLTGQSQVIISLIALDGRLLSQAVTTLVVSHSAPGAAPSTAPPASRPPAPPPVEAPSMLAERPPPAGAAAPPPAAVAAQQPPLLSGPDRARAERLQAQGEAYLANGNIIGARDFFERAADAGLAAGALRLAATYDPAELARLGAQGVAPDRDLARKWYERARDLGAPEAPDLLARLGGS